MNPRNIALRNKALLVLFVGALFSSMSAFSQTEPCGADVYQAELMQSPDYAASMQLLEMAYQARLNGNGAQGGQGTYIIPCVVHVLYDNQILDSQDQTTDAENTPDQAVINAICLTNKYLAGQDGSGVQVGPDTHIELRLATIDPNGSATTGIEHLFVTKSCSGIGAPSDCFSLSDLDSQFGWDPDSYLNIYSVDLLYGAIGWSGTFSLIALDNRMLNFLHPAPLQETKALVHEFGHYLNLKHVADGGCHDPADCGTAGDHVCDTEQTNTQYAPNGNTYVDISSDCPLETGFWPRYDFMSYAHYTSHRFTPGQIVRMESALLSPQGESHWTATNLSATGTGDLIPPHVVRLP